MTVRRLEEFMEQISDHRWEAMLLKLVVNCVASPPVPNQQQVNVQSDAEVSKIVGGGTPLP